MTQPQTDWYLPILIWIKDNTLQIGIISLVWRGIDKVFKYFSESRDIRLTQMVDKVVDAKLKPLEEKIDALTVLVIKGNE